MNKTYYKKRNNFSESHYKLPPNYGMFDIDTMYGEWLSLSDNIGTKQEATYIEYRCLKFDKDENRFNEDRIKYVAIFELKYHHTENVVNSLDLKPGSPLWATFMMSKQLGCRFFIVVATNGNKPFYFGEFSHITNKVENWFTLNYDYTIDDPKVIRDFWTNDLKITP